MSFIGDFRTVLLGDSGISALVGTRLYPDLLPQNPTLPALTYTQVSGIRETNLDGPMDLVERRIQIDGWTETALSRETLAEAVRLALNGFQGPLGGSPETGRIYAAFLDNEQSFYEPDTKLFRVSLDFRIVAYESVT